MAKNHGQSAMSKPSKARRRVINKAIDRRFALRNQRETAHTNRRGKSLTDLPDTPRRRKTPRGPRRVQLGIPSGKANWRIAILFAKVKS
jgi:hypothetical protein